MAWNEHASGASDQVMHGLPVREQVSKAGRTTYAARNLPFMAVEEAGH